MYIVHFRERPAAIPVHVKAIDDTSNFDDFSDADIRWPGAREASKMRDTGPGVSDLPWINYTFKVLMQNWRWLYSIDYTVVLVHKCKYLQYFV